MLLHTISAASFIILPFAVYFIIISSLPPVFCLASDAYTSYYCVQFRSRIMSCQHRYHWYHNISKKKYQVNFKQRDYCLLFPNKTKDPRSTFAAGIRNTLFMLRQYFYLRQSGYLLPDLPHHILIGRKLSPFLLDLGSRRPGDKFLIGKHAL